MDYARRSNSLLSKLNGLFQEDTGRNLHGRFEQSNSDPLPPQKVNRRCEELQKPALKYTDRLIEIHKFSSEKYLHTWLREPSHNLFIFDPLRADFVSQDGDYEQWSLQTTKAKVHAHKNQFISQCLLFPSHAISTITRWPKNRALEPERLVTLGV